MTTNLLRLLPCRLPLCLSALPLRSACLSALPAVLPIRRAGLPPPFCAIYKDARRRPRPCRPAACCRLLPLLPPAAAASAPALCRSFWPSPPYATNRDILVTDKNAENGHLLSIGASPYTPTCPSAAFSRNFLFLFFYFGTRSPILDSWPFLSP